jgi:hypothetical protein
MDCGFVNRKKMARPRAAPDLAEAVRFELTVGFPTLVFKTSALNRSATLPELVPTI